MDAAMMPASVQARPAAGGRSCIGRSTALAWGLIASILVSCGPAAHDESPPAAPAAPVAKIWPAGTALAVGDALILTSEVDRLADAIELFDRGKVRAASRRSALAAVLLPRAALANRYSAERAAARERAEGRLEELRAGLGADTARLAEGGWAQLGVLIWAETRLLELDSWGGPFEDIGRWLLLRPVEERPGAIAAADEYSVEVIEFPFVPSSFTPEDLQAVIESSKLTQVDPQIGDLVPADWRYRMHDWR